MAASTSRPRMSSSCCMKHPDAVLIEGFNAGDHICTECGVIVSDRVIGTLSNQNETDKEEQSLNSTMTKSELAHINARQDINIMAEWINLPRTIADRASNLFQQAHGNKNLRGRTNEAITAACLYIACRQEGAPRTIREISAVSSVSIKDIGRCFKIILRELETSLNLSTCDDFMSRFCTNLGLSEEVQRAATHIARRAVDMDIVSGKSPVSIAAAAIYMASQASVDKRTLKEIGEIAGVKSPVTYYLMIPHAHKLFPEDFQFDTPIKDLPRKQLPRISVPREPVPTSQSKNSVHPSKKYVLVDMYYTQV